MKLLSQKKMKLWRYKIERRNCGKKQVIKNNNRGYNFNNLNTGYYFRFYSFVCAFACGNFTMLKRIC